MSKQPRFAVNVAALLVISWVLVDLALMREAVLRHSTFPDWLSITALSLTLAQTTLLAAWVTFGQWQFGLRLCVAGPTCVALAQFTSACLGGTDFAMWCAMLLIYLGVLVAVFVFVRRMRYRIVLDGKGRLGVPLVIRPNQFTIWGLLMVTTSAGVFLTIVRFAELPMQNVLTTVVVFTTLAAQGSVCMLAIFQPRFRWRTVVGVLVVWAASVAVLTIGQPGPDLVEKLRVFGSLTLLQGFWIAVTVGVLRAAGCQMTRLDEPA